MDFSDAHAKLRQLGYYAHGIYLGAGDIDIGDRRGLKSGDYWAVLPIGTEFSFERLDQVAYFAGPRTGPYDKVGTLEDLIKAVRWAESQSYQKRMEQVGLIGAVKMGDIEAVKWLLDHGADVNAREDDKYGWTALLYAQENHHLDIVKALIHKGADVNMGDNNRRTPLICASRLGNTDIVKELLAAGADVNAKDNVGWTALNQASQQFRESGGYESYKEIIQLLKQGGAQE